MTTKGISRFTQPAKFPEVLCKDCNGHSDIDCDEDGYRAVWVCTQGRCNLGVLDESSTWQCSFCCEDRAFKDEMPVNVKAQDWLCCQCLDEMFAGICVDQLPYWLPEVQFLPPSELPPEALSAPLAPDLCGCGQALGLGQSAPCEACGVAS